MSHRRLVDYSPLPESLRQGAKDYIERGWKPGDFLTAVFENNLSEAFGRADRNNRWLLGDIVEWVFNETPSTCWGSKEKVAAWIEARREEAR